MNDIEQALTIPVDWWQSVLDSVDHTFLLNEPTAEEAHHAQLKRRLQSRYYQSRFRRNSPDKYRANYRRYEHRKREAPGGHTSAELETLKRTQKGCWWCGKPITDQHHIDHVVPLSRGGSNDISNLRVTCPPCNARKKDKLPAEFAGRLF